VHIYDRESGLGGTWFVNQYPGAACDVPAVLYSLSFAPNPNWSAMMCPYGELLEYLTDVARKYELESRMTFRTECVSANWDEDAARWRVTLRNVDTGAEFIHECKILFMAVGHFGRPRTAESLGMQNVDLFKGPIVHSARWEHSVDLCDKRVVVVGNGSECLALTSGHEP
jgi:cation diffusion facilitator CzcD-associated flavoprotein CzcO